MISAVQRERVASYFEIAKAEGGTFATGGDIIDQPGNWIQPTVVAGLDNSSRLAQEEIFGPVLVVIAHDGDDDAVRIANDSAYGLSGSVDSGDLARAKAVAARIRTGTLAVNGGVWFSPDAPFGGYKQSGIGREMGVAGFEEYLETKVIAEPAPPAEAPAGTQAPASAESSPVEAGDSPTNGKVFFRNQQDGRDYVCSGSAVNSASKRLVITAGHCVHGGPGETWHANWVFVPGYDHGPGPEATFAAASFRAFDEWITHGASGRGFSSDVAFVTTQDNENGETVAVWLESEAETTLKTFYLEGSQVRLQPQNATMDPIYTPAENVRIMGKLVSVIRSIP